ncbi:hypothetical protein MIND_00733700 [Mycena indigotica]|uniref:HNH nuclease domain-containing protein n=1 Tax=Mycena indigotica TaxID=2126181 RepID=A0A8H6W1L6_9AGAR|nr:uncharacterized protein MIND_00733700 [Mycena indigotica]KAF7301682.1 hypothetical protein MIND_00733700 [Mycena indigotica]
MVKTFPVVNHVFDTSILPDSSSTSSMFLSSYNRVVSAEKQALLDHAAAPSQNTKRDIVMARVLAFLHISLHRMQHAMGLQPLQHLDKEISSASGDPFLYDLGEQYVTFLGVFRTYKLTPVPSKFSSREPFDDMLEAQPTIYVDPWLARDNFQCIISNGFDLDSLKTSPDLVELMKESHGYPVSVRGCCIFDHARLYGFERDDGKHMGGTSALALLRSLGMKDIVDRFSVTGLHQLGVHNLINVVSMQPNVAALFHTLNLVLEPVAGEENAYDIVCAEPNLLRGLAHVFDRVTFQNHAKENLSLPDPRLLALHAVCARVVHMSGAADVWPHPRDDDDEDLLVLEPDGTSMDMLYAKLAPFVIVEA